MVSPLDAVVAVFTTVMYPYLATTIASALSTRGIILCVPLLAVSDPWWRGNWHVLMTNIKQWSMFTGSMARLDFS
jgi:hypothetical protein